MSHNQFEKKQKTKENKTNVASSSLANNNPRYQCQYTSDKRQTRNITITVPIPPLPPSTLEHIVKGHHQHNRHAVATKKDVKLKKRGRGAEEKAKPNPSETMMEETSL